MYEEESKETIHVRVLCMMHVWCVYACRTNASFFLSIDYSLGLFFLSSTSMLLYFFFSRLRAFNRGVQLHPIS